MRRITLVSSIIAATLALPAIAGAGTYTFKPSDADLGDLDHNYYYTWRIGWTLPAGESIFGASLFIDEINNWRVEPNILYIHLLDTASSGVRSYYDNEGGGDAFSGQGILLTTFTDDDPYPNPPEDFLYTFTASNIQKLNEYLADGRFAFGFDPDCHFYNCGVSFKLETRSVPEPVTALLAAPVIAFLRRTRNRRLAARPSSAGATPETRRCPFGL